MIKQKINLFLILMFTIVQFGCFSSATVISIDSDDALVTISSIDPMDWSNITDKAIQSLLTSGALQLQDGEKSVVMISRIRNYTLQHIDTQILTAKIRSGILKSGQGHTTSAIGNKSNLDLAVRRTRELGNDDLFNQETVQQSGTVIAPNMSLSGAITQQTTYQGRTEESYFLFHLTLTDLRTGLAVWEYTDEILKQGKHPIL